MQTWPVAGCDEVGINPCGIAASRVATNGTNNIYVVDTANSLIRKFNSDGDELSQWGSYGEGKGELREPRGIAVDNLGNVYVIDTGNHRVQKFDSNGNYLLQWGYYGNKRGEFNNPLDVAVDSKDNIYVVDSGNHRIQKFNSSGTYILHWGRKGSANGEFQEPLGIGIDNNDNTFVTDRGRENGLIQMFSSTGQYITQWGDKGSGVAKFEIPADVALDNRGYAYVSDEFEHRVQVFSNLKSVILNGSFEELPPLGEWAYGGRLPVSQAVQSVKNGSYALQLGKPVPQIEQSEGVAWAHQTFYVDPSWNRPTLLFYYNLHVNDTQDFSDFFVTIQDGVGLNHLATIVEDGYRSCDPVFGPPAGTDLGWRQAAYDLSTYKDKHIRLVFSNRNLHHLLSLGIWTYVDSVQVVEAGPLPVPPGPWHMYLPLILNGYQSCDQLSASLRDEHFDRLWHR